MSEVNRTGSGVDALIGRIRDEGVAAANTAAKRILDTARREASALLKAARDEADAYRDSARTEIATEKSAAEEALRLAIRDTRLELSTLVTNAFERTVRRLVSHHALDKDVIKAMLLVLAGRAAEEFVNNKQLLIELPRLLFNEHPGGTTEEEKAALHQTVLGLTHEMLSEGIELLPADDLTGGARVRLVGEDLELDLSDEAVSRLLLRQLMPRYRAIIEGLE